MIPTTPSVFRYSNEAHIFSHIISSNNFPFQALQLQALNGTSAAGLPGAAAAVQPAAAALNPAALAASGQLSAVNMLALQQIMAAAAAQGNASAMTAPGLAANGTGAAVSGNFLH